MSGQEQVGESGNHEPTVNIGWICQNGSRAAQQVETIPKKKKKKKVGKSSH